MRCFAGPHGFVYVLWCHASPHLEGGGLRTPAGAMTLKFEHGRDFCAVHLPRSFIILCLVVWKLSFRQTHPQTNKQTGAAENIQRSAIRYDVRTLGMGNKTSDESTGRQLL